MRSEIEDAGGNEVFALGYLDDQGLVSRIEVTARGNEGMVPAAWSETGSPGGEGLPDVLIHNHPSGFLVPSDNDLLIASEAAEAGTGSFIVDNRVESVYVVAEPSRRRTVRKLDSRKICAALEEGGAIARRLPAYEARSSQLDLMRLIIRAFNEDVICAAEAGTGVGKSFAYLLPAMSYALDNDERIVISTATINLQQQLYEKDIPLVSAALNKEIKVVLMKGRGNYLCRRRLDDALREPALDNAERDETEAIAAWAETSRTGSRSDLAFMPSEAAWSRVCSEADICLGLRCPERERCFVFMLRKECAAAKILVVNHHLLFADLAARHGGAGYEHTAVLPPYARVIVDEAHTIETAATSFFSEEFSRVGLFRQLGRLYRKRRARQSGLLVRLASLVSLEDKLDQGAEAVSRVREALESLDTAALELCGEEGIFRLTAARFQAVSPALLPCFMDLRKIIASLGKLVRDMLENLSPKDEENPAAAAVVWEVKAVIKRLESAGSLCTAFIEYRERPGEVMWIEARQGARGGEGGAWALFTATPLEVAPPLAESLFKPNKTVVCLSATLTVAGSFSYWQSRSGIDLLGGREILSGEFPSPFPYESSVLLAVPEDAPLPDAPAEYRAFVDKAAAALAETSGGSALILFTSYTALKSAYAAAAPLLEKQGIRCFKQGDDDRSRLLSSFLSDESSVLFATDSFWEGVDAPGDTLRLVILCRLPFKSPSDPVCEARSEALEKQGRNAFMELSLPEAVMKFRQGFGRLMRRSADHGVVAVLDGRLLHKRYGAYFLNSLPPARTSFEPFQSLLGIVERFLFP